MENSAFGPVLDWNEVINKKARSLDDATLGRVQEINETSFILEKGTKNKEKFYIPRSIPNTYNGNIILLDITEDEAKKKFMNDTSAPASSTEESKVLAKKEENEETIVPLTEERLEVTKKETMEEATVLKESVKKTKTVEVQLTHEELIIEKRRPSSNSGDTTSVSSPLSEKKQIQSKTEITIPLKKEEVVVTKKPYVKEEIVIKKKPVTETKAVTEDVISEKVKDTDISREVRETKVDE